jgi:molecular chaperone DnaK|tara:strand:+ start:1399 stop:3954 length:2556 start_codon:yes stop_codon:yes gene_type:complete
MARTKIDYGIDLGTTNSAIARMEHGEPIIKKSEGYQMDTTPSCVHYNKKKTLKVGKKAYNLLDKEKNIAFQKNDKSLINAFEEFKRTMGTDEKYESINMGKSFSSEELSAQLLKALKGYVRDEEINSIVITVPAKFQGYQKDATIDAAKLAGFQHCILLPEPIAASMAYGVDAKAIDGEWLVFDFGGGTFDAALMKSVEGIMKVVDTEGDNHLGGKNLDLAIVDEIIIPYLKENYSIANILADDERKSLLRNAIKRFAEETKINLSPADKNQYDILTDEAIGEDDEGEEIEIDLTVTKEQYEKVVKPIFQRAVDLSLKLLKNNNLTGSDLTTVLMIGGPTFSETVRDMIREQITEKVEISIDPMIAVAQGAALYASTKDIPEDIRETDKTKIQLKLSYQPDIVEIETKVGVRVLRDKTEGDVPEKLFVELKRQDKGWASGKVELKGDSEIIDILLEAGKSNSFEVVITDDKGTELPCEPGSFSIIQGFKTAGATLPFGICVDILDTRFGKQQLTVIKGLSKNQTLPAKGSGVFKTQNDVRPGNKSDQIRIPVYYANEPGTKAIYHLDGLRGEVIITGEDLPGMLPKGSDVELSIEIDESEMITVSATIPYLDDEIIDNVIDTEKRKMPSKEEIEKRLKKANDMLANLEEEYPEVDQIKIEEIRNVLNKLSEQLDKGGSEADTREEIFGQINKKMIAIDELESAGEWPKVMQELTEALEYLEATKEQFGNKKAEQIVKQLNDQVKIVIEKQDLKMAKDLTEQIAAIDFALVDQGAGVALEISYIKGFDDNFDIHEWKNRSQARQLINEAKGIINANRATKDNLRPIVVQLFELLPKAQQGISGQTDDDVLVK